MDDPRPPPSPPMPPVSPTRRRRALAPVRLAFAFLVLAAGWTAAPGCGAPEEPDPRPNLLVLVSDDQGTVLGCYGHAEVQTPRLDAVAERALVFRRAYAPSAVCTPSRTTLYTGLMPMHHGARGFEEVGEGVKVWGEHLGDAGYRTGLIGKLGAKPIARFPFDYIARSDKDDEDGRSVAWHLERLDEFLDGDDGRPWCLVVNFRDSHWPFPEDGAPYGPRTPPPHDPAVLTVPPTLVDAPAVRAELAHYYDGLRRMDATAGAMLDRLVERRQAEGLVGLFTSDNGPPFPYAKTTLYEAGVHMPLIVFGTGVQGGYRDELVGLVDVLPTLLELAGTGASGLDGRSFAPALRGESLGLPGAPWRDQIATTHDDHRVEPRIPSRAVRFGDWKYVRTWGEGLDFQNNVMLTSETWRAMVEAAPADPRVAALVERFVHRPAEELFDLGADPDELHDLSGDPARAGILAEARRRLAESPLVDLPGR